MIFFFFSQEPKLDVGIPYSRYLAAETLWEWHIALILQLSSIMTIEIEEEAASKQN